MGRCYLATGRSIVLKCTRLDLEDRGTTPKSRFRPAELTAQAEPLSGEAAERTKVDSDPNDQQRDLALAYYAQGDNAQAIDELVIILREPS